MALSLPRASLGEGQLTRGGGGGEGTDGRAHDEDTQPAVGGAPHLRHCLGFGPRVGATDEATVHHGQATLPLPRGVLRYDYMRLAVEYFNVMRAWPSLASTLLIMMWS
uniref:Uncharacterized protein n=1 Tax=Oryza barthii TaxID=65489 RepID=A0A0D3FJH7_9ORYZ